MSLDPNPKPLPETAHCGCARRLFRSSDHSRRNPGSLWSRSKRWRARLLDSNHGLPERGE